MFFLSVGLLIDLDYLVKQAWVIGAALVVVTGGKTFLNWLLLMASGERFLVALEASLFLSPVGEFSFVIAGAGLAVGVLSPAGHKLAIAVIAMSLLVSPIFFLGARLVHRLTTGHLKIIGVDLASQRLWRTLRQTDPAPSPALTDHGG